MASTNKDIIYNSELEKVIKENKKKPYKKNPSKISFMSNNFKTETLYIGSKKRNNRMFLRIYNKKQEQLS